MIYGNTNSSVNMRVVVGFSTLVMTVFLTICEASPSKPQLGSGESFDGLREVHNARADKAWIRSDLDLSSYTKILPRNLGVEYRPVKRSASRSQTVFPVSAKAQERLEALIAEIIPEELAKSERFKITDQPGPGVLIVVGALLDVVSNVPPERIGRSDIYLSRVGEATLVLELRDSETNAILARVLDRRAAEKAGVATWSNTVNNTAEVRRLIRRWATLLRTRLDEVPSFTAVDD